MKQLLIPLFLCCCIAFINTNCKHTPTGPTNSNAALTVADVNCTEVWLMISVPNNEIVTLKRDTTVLDTIHLTTADTLVVDANLLPSHTYTYTLAREGAANVTTQATTMDTTSHNFMWQTYTLGDGSSSSVLNDVAIINDTLAYAVGDIYQGGLAYNMAKWDGQSWSTNQILYPYQGQQFYSQLRSVFVFSENDLWVGSNQPMHWNGTSWQTFNLSASIWNGWIYKIWGSSSSNLYIVGGGGSIAHYNGTNWTKIESGTSLDILDIYGSNNEVLAVASTNNPLDKAIISINGNTANQILSFPLGQIELYGVWFISNRQYYVVGGGIYEKHLLSEATWKNGPLDITQYTTTKVRGTGINDVFAVGAYGEFLHFNGVTWKSYIVQTGINGAYGGLAVQGNKVIAVGQANANAIITIGTRN